MGCIIDASQFHNSYYYSDRVVNIRLPSRIIIHDEGNLFQARLEIRLKRWRARGRKKLRSRWTARGPRSDRTSPPNWAVCSPDFLVWRVPNASPVPSGRNSPITPVSLRIFPFLVHATPWRPSLTIVDEVNGVPARRPVIVINKRGCGHASNDVWRDVSLPNESFQRK